MTMRIISWAVAGVIGLAAVAWIVGSLVWTPAPYDGFDTAAFGRLPVSYGGRFKPIDTVARNSLIILSGRQTLHVDGEKHPAIIWLLDTILKPERSDSYAVFRVDNKEVRSLFNQDGSKAKRFSYEQIAPAREQIQRYAQKASNTDRAARSVFEHQVLKLANNLALYQNLQNHQSIHNIPLPSMGTGDWASFADTLLVAQQMGREPAVLADYRQIYKAYMEGDAETFNRTTAALRGMLAAEYPEKTAKAGVEWRFNIAAPFSKAMPLYVITIVLVMASWLCLPRVFRNTALVLIVIALVLHTAGLVVRVYLSGRPPVTNLYSSAVFVGWGVVGMSLLMELILKRGLGLIVGAAIGFTTLLIAQGLSADGDTLAVLQAVLDTNFWLATHVIMIIIGYMGVFLAGAFGIVYIIMGVCTPLLTKPISKSLAQVIYGVVCMATLTSFIGTILGGIWADQSWGRFWGWDPKENGALMIVIWNAVILHARWGGLVRDRGIAVLAVFGNVVCAWSWFGTNMLGAGLHSYGFTDGAFGWTMAFLTAHAVFIAAGTMPMEAWWSGKHLMKPRVPPDRPPATGARSAT